METNDKKSWFKMGKHEWHRGFSEHLKQQH